MKYEIIRTTQFKKDYKIIKKRKLNLNLLKSTILKLIDGEKLSSDHILSGNWNGYRECHIQPNWLLIYKLQDNIIILVRTGTHSDLFK